MSSPDQFWRPVAIGKSPTTNGIAPACTHFDDSDKHDSPYIYSCCPEPHIEIGPSSAALRIALLLNAYAVAHRMRVRRLRVQLTLACAALFVVSLVLIRATW